VATELAAVVRPRAAVHGVQVSGWIRLIHRERLRLVVHVWWIPCGGRPRIADPAPFRLERLGVLANDRVDFSWLDDRGLPVVDRAARATLGDGADELGTFMLRGDPRLWRVHPDADADVDGAMRVVLEPVRRRFASEKPSVIEPSSRSRRPTSSG
jgi:hypothetical protein